MVFNSERAQEGDHKTTPDANLTIGAIDVMIDVILTQKLAEIAVLNVTNPPRPTDPNPKPFSLEQKIAYLKKKTLQSVLRPESPKERAMREEIEKNDDTTKQIEPMEEKIERILIAEIEKLKD